MMVPSLFSTTDVREGIYVKLGDGTRLTHRFKRVRKNFIAGEHWMRRSITKNRMVRS
jgi:hypothetical protein